MRAQEVSGWWIFSGHVGCGVAEFGMPLVDRGEQWRVEEDGDFPGKVSWE